jgi:hypothetical protein
MAFERITIEQPEVGANGCSPAVVNSTGAPVTLRATGAAIALDDDLRLVAEDLP